MFDHQSWLFEGIRGPSALLVFKEHLVQLGPQVEGISPEGVVLLLGCLFNLHAINVDVEAPLLPTASLTFSRRTPFLFLFLLALHFLFECEHLRIVLPLLLRKSQAVRDCQALLPGQDLNQFSGCIPDLLLTTPNIFAVFSCRDKQLRRSPTRTWVHCTTELALACYSFVGSFQLSSCLTVLLSRLDQIFQLASDLERSRFHPTVDIGQLL